MMAGCLVFIFALLGCRVGPPRVKFDTWITCLIQIFDEALFHIDTFLYPLIEASALWVLKFYYLFSPHPFFYVFSSYVAPKKKNLHSFNCIDNQLLLKPQLASGELSL